MATASSAFVRERLPQPIWARIAERAPSLELWGAARMGVRHGLYCLGCCWALMALLFVGGAMNLLWIAALTLLVAMEKIAPKGDILAKALGALMIGVGAARLIWQPS
jgi:predicted metal-binding membrane protein